MRIPIHCVDRFVHLFKKCLMIIRAIYGAWHDMLYGLKTSIHSAFAKNVISLYIIQFANYLFPFITVPYLIRTLGPSDYGLVAFGQSLILFFSILTNYGFAFSATRKISLEREDILAVSKIVFNVWAAKALLGMTGFLLLLSAVSAVPKLRETSVLLFILYGTVIGNILFPTWLFQAMERMVAISVINLLTQLFIIIGVFTMIHRPEDYVIYAGLVGIGSIFSGLVGASAAIFIFKLQFILPTSKGISEALREGWILFLSMASISLYTGGNAFILGILSNSSTAVGYYSIAEKIVMAILGLLNPIAQAAYPKFSRLSLKSRSLILQQGRIMLVSVGCLGLLLSVMLFISAPFIVRIIFGSELEPSIIIIRILAPLPFLVAVSNVLGLQIAFPLKLEKAIFLLGLLAGAINITLSFLLVPMMSSNGMALSVLFSELFITISYFVYLSSKRLNPLRVYSPIQI